MKLDPVTGLKHCRSCGGDLPPTEYHRRSDQSDGLQKTCKSCLLVARRENNRLRREGIPSPIIPSASILPDDQLRDMYLHGFTGFDIAHLIGRSGPAIHVRLRRMGIVRPNDPHTKESFKRRCIVDEESGCWAWTGNKNVQGYGRTRHRGRTTGAHRVSYRLFRGEIADDLEIDHLCNNRICVNPDHLEAVTGSENLRRQHNRRKALTCVSLPEDWGTTLQGLRSARGWSQAELSRRAHVSVVVVGYLERGVRDVYMRNLTRIASVFGLTIQQLIAA